MTTTWGDIYHRHVNRGEDPGFAAYMADNWERRQKPILHLVTMDGAACGLKVVPAECLTDDPALVTCGRCRRSGLMKERTR